GEQGRATVRDPQRQDRPRRSTQGLGPAQARLGQPPACTGEHVRHHEAPAARPSERPPATAPWWSDAVSYEVYILSFADSDEDGTGDLQGIIDRLDHIQTVGVDAVWITPFFPSPGHDHGYDVSDFRSIDPAFGDTDTFQRLVDELHQRGIRLLVDVVPNHTSHEH